ncbi:MAG: hypothetical protein SFU56_06740 [Capsulimonadales bacterium]|nr:hypothetical protein [Capsulimonadales bacterium]
MNSFWDWLVLVGGIGQIAGLIAVAVALLKLKNGPVRELLRKVRGFVRKGEELVSTFDRTYQRSLPRLVGMGDHLTATGNSVREAGNAFQSVTAEGRALLIRWAELRTVLETLRTGARMLRRARPRNDSADSGKTSGKRASRASIADRMGLVPPIVGKLSRFSPALRYGLAVYRELKQRGLIKGVR